MIENTSKIILDNYVLKLFLRDSAEINWDERQKYKASKHHNK